MFFSIEEFHQKLKNKEFSCAEIVKKYFEKIEEKDKELGAYLHLTKDLAYLQADLVDQKISKGEEIPLLAGVPLAIKDNILIKDEKTTAASKVLKNYKASYDATVIKKLKEKLAVFLGKTNLDEFAMGSSTENSGFKITKNPYDKERVPGGSSGGSAVAVAADMCLAALGSDTGGSIRQPAGFCNVFGLKPTYGSVSRFGLIAMASSLDQIGPMAKNVKDIAILFEAISGKDRYDATSKSVNYQGLKNFDLEKAKSLKIGLPKEFFNHSFQKIVELEIKNAINILKSLKIEFKEISLPYSKYAISSYYIIMPAEVSANLARYDGLRYGNFRSAKSLEELYFSARELFGDEVKRRIILGTFVLSHGYYDAYYKKAQKIRELIKKDFQKAFEEVDLIFTPTSPTLPFKIGEKTDDPLKMYLSDIFTIPVNLAGLPALNVPVCRKPLGLPVGFQLIGKPFQEKDILNVAYFYEQAS